MSLTADERAELIKYRLDEAKDTIQDVQLLLENDRYRAAVNRIYYGMFYSLLALGWRMSLKHPSTNNCWVGSTKRLSTMD